MPELSDTLASQHHFSGSRRLSEIEIAGRPGGCLDWREVRLEDVAGFGTWLRRPPAARDGSVAVLS